MVGHGDGQESLTFGEVDAQVRRVAAGMLSDGLEPGDRVMVALGNTSLTPLCFFGAAAAGLVALPVSDQLTGEEREFLRDDARAHVITPDAARAWLRQKRTVGYRATDPEHAAFMVYTSGTTGIPKGVLHAHRSVRGRRPMYQGWYGIREGDVMLHAGALNWTYTLGVGLMDPWANAATAVIHNGPSDRRVWPALIERHRATLFAAVPGVYRQLLESDALAGRDISSLRHALVAGESLNPHLWQQWRHSTGLELYEALGMSEISTFISSGPDTPTQPGSPGRPQPGRRIVVDLTPPRCRPGNRGCWQCTGPTLA